MSRGMFNNDANTRASIENALLVFEQRFENEQAALRKDFAKLTKFLHDFSPIYLVFHECVNTNAKAIPGNAKASEDFMTRVNALADKIEEISTAYRNQAPSKSLVPKFLETMRIQQQEAAAKTASEKPKDDGLSFMKPGSLRKGFSA